MKKLLIFLVILLSGCASKQDVKMLRLEFEVQKLQKQVETLGELNSLNFQFDALQQGMIEELQKRLAMKQV